MPERCGRHRTIPKDPTVPVVGRHLGHHRFGLVRYGAVDRVSAASMARCSGLARRVDPGRSRGIVGAMCRSIKTLRRADEPATEEEIRAAALQFVRKVSGYRAPARANAEAFQSAVDEIAESSRRLLDQVAAPR